MSYSVSLNENGRRVRQLARWLLKAMGASPRTSRVCSVERHTEGCIYDMKGSTEACLSITYNYAQHFRQVLGDEGIWGLDEMASKDAIPILEAAVGVLGVVQSWDYWAATPGNAGYALAVLLAWARVCPEAVFRVGWTVTAAVERPANNCHVC